MFLYKNYNEEQLNNQYNTRLQVPEFAAYFERWQALSSNTKNQLPCIENIYYGTHERECLDVFPSSTPHAKTLVFIHGGYWHLFHKNMFHFIANAFYAAGVTTVLINYPLAPATAINDMVSSCRKALLWLHQHVTQYNGNPQQLYITGHSAGAHLAAMLLTNMPAHSNNYIQGACLLSGIYNLLPIQLLQLNNILHITADTAAHNSPVTLPPPANCPLLISVGEAESHEFISQSRDLYESWKSTNTATQYLPLPGINHYSILETFTDATTGLHAAMRRLMQL